MSGVCELHGRIRCWECAYIEELKERTLFNDEELEIIRELLSIVACGYERETWNFDCCDANPIIEKIDKYLKKK
jgi:hypothetical protein